MSPSLPYIPSLTTANTQGCHASHSWLFAFTWKICISEESCCLPSQNILKRTKEGTKEEQTASKALDSVSKVKAAHSSPSALPTNVFDSHASGNLTSAIVWQTFYWLSPWQTNRSCSNKVVFSCLTIVFFFQIIDECNTQVGKMKQMEELIQINQSLEFDKLKVRMEMPKWLFVVGI